MTDIDDEAEFTQLTLEDLVGKPPAQIDTSDEGVHEVLSENLQLHYESGVISAALRKEQNLRVKAEREKRSMQEEVEELSAKLFTEASDRIVLAWNALELEKSRSDALTDKIDKMAARLQELETLLQTQHLQLEDLKEILRSLDSCDDVLVSAASSSSVVNFAVSEDAPPKYQTFRKSLHNYNASFCSPKTEKLLHQKEQQNIVSSIFAADTSIVGSSTDIMAFVADPSLKHPFFKTKCMEDLELCLKFPGCRYEFKLHRRLVHAVVENTLIVEAIRLPFLSTLNAAAASWDFSSTSIIEYALQAINSLLYATKQHQQNDDARLSCRLCFDSLVTAQDLAASRPCSSASEASSSSSWTPPHEKSNEACEKSTSHLKQSVELSVEESVFYRFKLSDNDTRWKWICAGCRDRLVTSAEFCQFVRLLSAGHFKGKLSRFETVSQIQVNALRLFRARWAATATAE